MKRIACNVCCLLIACVAFGQPNSTNFKALQKKGDSLYRAVDYPNAAAIYSSMLRLPGEKLTIWDWHRAAFAYSLSSKPDSAFYFLNLIAGLDSIDAVDYLAVADDGDFDSLQKDRRWKAFKDQAFENSRKTYHRYLPLRDPKTLLFQTKWLAIAFAFNGQLDSAFYHLDRYAGSPELNFSLANETINRTGYIRRFQKDARWPGLRAKMYGNVARSLTNDLRKSGDTARNLPRRQAAIAWTQAGQPDSAFYLLNLIADSEALKFEDVFFIITDGEFSNVASVSEFKPLENDPRWVNLKDKFFRNLYKKYIPKNAFVKTQKSKKRMLIDGGHFNLHDIEGTYAPLAGPLKYAGFIVEGITGKFEAGTLDNTDILLISNPNADRQDSLVKRAQRAGEPFRWSAAATQPGYTNEEIAVIHDWVQKGGSLWLILDHAPNGKVGESLAAAFGLENRNVGTYDPLNRDPAVDTTEAITLLFTRSKGLIGNHPIVEGIDRITTYTGESLVGPPGSTDLLHLPATAMDQDWLPETRKFRYRTAEGRSQGVAFEYGKGRVVMLGEAAITRPNSLSRTDSGNWKFMLNIIRWLAREI